MEKPREVFIVSDGTGLTAEMFGQSILAQFSTPFRLVRKPFVDSIDKAVSVAEEVNSRSKITGLQPIVFTTLVKPEISGEIYKANCLVINMFEGFISQLEKTLNLKSHHVINRLHHNADTQSYRNRISSINFSLIHDDGQSQDSLDDADIILVGVSRSGKTPTCLYLAVQFGLKAANYPITPEDLEVKRLPNRLLNVKDKLFGLTINPIRLSEIRYERFPNSKYATLKNCQYEIRETESLMQVNNIQYLSTTNKSIEEIASSLLQKINPETITLIP
tara:strand:- start:751 stop:1578 length:828 start_codon:yes stop_codon:yes gene_type:complete